MRQTFKLHLATATHRLTRHRTLKSMGKFKLGIILALMAILIFMVG